MPKNLPNQYYERSSEILERIIRDPELKQKMTIGRLLDVIGDRAFGVAILFFALLNVLPFAMIPGYSTITSIPIFFFSAQMVLGLSTLWLPKKIKNFEFSHAKVAAALTKGLPYLKKLERIFKPRWLWLSSPIMEKVIGVIFLILSILLMLPIPFSNPIFGVAIALISLGLIERDGIVIAIGTLIVLIGLASFIILGKYIFTKILNFFHA